MEEAAKLSHRQLVKQKAQHASELIATESKGLQKALALSEANRRAHQCANERVSSLDTQVAVLKQDHTAVVAKLTSEIFQLRLSCSKSSHRLMAADTRVRDLEKLAASLQSQLSFLKESQASEQQHISKLGQSHLNTTNNLKAELQESRKMAEQSQQAEAEANSQIACLRKQVEELAAQHKKSVSHTSLQKKLSVSDGVDARVVSLQKQLEAAQAQHKEEMVVMLEIHAKNMAHMEEDLGKQNLKLLENVLHIQRQDLGLDLPVMKV
jgi:predicted  nucleic acid-binding Zn-ribbon protein